MITSTFLVVVLAAVYPAYRCFSALLTSFLKKQFTVLEELGNLGKLRSDGCRIDGTVVIAGGSLAGLWTARICADHFKRVLVVDPEAWLDTDAASTPHQPEVRYVGEDRLRASVNPRAHVAQYNSLHGLHLAPYEHLLTAQSKSLHYCSRALIETLIRRNVKKMCSNVEFVVGTITGINPDLSNQSKINSVSYKVKDGNVFSEEPATLFVDCAGPSHNGLRWLTDAGYGDLKDAQVPTDKLPLSKFPITYHPRMVYSTSVWPVDAEQRADLECIIPGGYAGQAWFFTYIAMPERGCANCAIGRQENNQVRVLCGGWGGFELPRNPDEIVEFYRNMQGHRPVPDWVFSLFDVLFRSSDQVTFDNFRVPQCSRVVYGKVVNMPTNFIAIGDACLRVNPVYGQGHSKGILGATILNSLLHQVPSDAKGLPRDFASTFLEAQERKVCSPMWDSTKTQDYSYKTTTPAKGESLTDGALVRWYSTNLMLTTTWSTEVAKAFNDTQMLIAPSLIVFQPSIVMKVLWQGLTNWGA